MQRLWGLVTIQATVAAASLIVEIVAGRMLAPYVGMSLYTWTSVIAVVLAGFSVGHWAGGRMAEWSPEAALKGNGWAMLGAAASTAAAVFILRGVAGTVIPALQSPVASIVVLTSLVFFLPSFFAGIPAPILSMIAVLRHPERKGRALGAMFAAGAWGAILGTLAAGFVFISWLGSVGTLAVVAAVYAVLGLMSLASASGLRGIVAGAAAALVPFGLVLGGLSLPNPCTVESDYFCIRVIDEGTTQAPVRLMVLDHLVHGAADGLDPTAMLTPHGVMLEGLPRLRMEGREGWSAFLIGGGTYTVPRAWHARGTPVAVTVAEVDPAVTRAAIDYFWYDPGEDRIIHADARRTLAWEPAAYDVIIGDAFGDIAVPQHLITREFFALVDARLNPGGVYLMNVIDHMDRLDVLASIVTTARAVWPSVEVWADPAHDASENRRVFVLVAGDAPSPRSQIGGPDGAAVRIAASSLQAILDGRTPVTFTDDFAPIDRLLSDRGEG
ncbi:fused MFS/spermidine synthase [Pararhodobacter zhoushanensis]|uniref:Fused MFS/spermidine synthase n=1 Tax=Pararhodobacter zhoushanensis TaxID=2479545 RepID=A0ABT3H0S9_9RHOB|nr:fused MFS/spermidine synthase [Pararhodobacter zhoushanensis]MCW1933392.1 fused MFS/spermidine synthase [Pararhodobacter zhoushanensis]